MTDPLPGSGWTVLMTSYNGVGWPHLDALRASNPGADIRIALDDGPGDRGFRWRNNDLFVREWWRAHGSRTGTERIALLEHDVLVTCALPDIGVSGIAGAQVKRPGDEWYWWPDMWKLGGTRRYVTGVVPMGVTFFSRAALDLIAGSGWDHLYDRDIFCEMRVPSIIRACGLPVIQVDLPNVGTNPIRAGAGPGIYHPVKVAGLTPEAPEP